jgi:xanthine dehydrogenase iron-sulfur cluster and FAD-binding subunit A
VHELQRAGFRVGRHVAPASLDEALELLAAHGPAARAIAGGTDLILELDRRVRDGIEVLVDLTRIPEADRIEDHGEVVVLGPLVTHNDAIASRLVVDHALPLAQACLEVGSPALRNRATIAGNLVTASPANDTISALWALDAYLTVRSLDGRREVPVRDLYTGLRSTVLEPDELIVAIGVPKLAPSARGVFVKLGQRRAQAISVVHLAAVVDLDRAGVVRRASLALGSVAPTVVSATAAEERLVGRPLDDETIHDAARLAADGVTPIDDVRATAAYRSEEIAVMVRRALRTLHAGRERERWPSRPIFLRGIRVPTPTGLPRTEHDDTTPVECVVNGTPRSVPGGASATLLDWLRDEVGLTGTKEGCAEGECGACTVHLDGAAVLACLVPAARVHGATITTIEGLGRGDGLHPLQQAFVDQFAVQCGFCIPGFLMSGERLLEECPHPTHDDTALGLSGNLCRCTGYYRFYEATEQASARW